MPRFLRRNELGNGIESLGGERRVEKFGFSAGGLESALSKGKKGRFTASGITAIIIPTNSTFGRESTPTSSAKSSMSRP